MEEELNLMRRKLEETMKENLRLNAENIQLRENLKEYQRNLDNCELNQEAQKVMRSGVSGKKEPRKSFRKSIKKITKADIAGPKLESLVHINGVRMESGRMRVVDNSGLLDPRIRRFLALEGIDERVTEDPKKLDLIERFVRDTNLFSVLEKARNKNKRKSLFIMESNNNKTDKKSDHTVPKPTLTPPPPPPPLPPPPPQMSLLNTPPPLQSNRLSVGLDSPGSSENLTEMIKRRGSMLKPPDPNNQRSRHSSSGSLRFEEDELVSALRRALDKINRAVGDSSDQSE
ncbi:wiskott-Aldrich syndrome protein [Eurytemora carolleeae]|uniref:wiskott-Aldrich syndrome protein n=1 Tax=Eurytemora carolleeae TaxID=1294199 RepID=UPI000C78A5FF|nr:wiskott-Aldrich syndrome protein [Eurytemora carolleeae]|eukprot:XP_023325092.1 wiskott-Aldrich syndrome protein-like [Eurytemora affinis]